MNVRYRLLLVALVVCVWGSGSTALAQAEGDGTLRVIWRDGLRATSADGRFELRFGGRLQTDLNWPAEEPFDSLVANADSGMEVRRARLFVQGRMYGDFEYKFELDFAGGEVSGKDMYAGLRNTGLEELRFGHLKEPFSLEELTSSRFITFMERSLINTLAPSRNTGVLLADTFGGGAWRWEAGVFRDSEGFDATPGSNYNVTGRLVWAGELGDGLLHLGAAFQFRSIDGMVRYSARPDHNAPRLLSLGLPADGASTLGLEAAWMFGPAVLQAEYVATTLDAPVHGDPRVHGYYIQASTFLTRSEVDGARTWHRVNYSDGGYGRPITGTDNVFPGGAGAWEVAARYARLDLSEMTDSPPSELWNLTLGVNWYWNPHVRWMFNYELANFPELRVDTASIFHTRFMFDF